MTLATWCVLIGGLMPLLWTGIAKFTGPKKLAPAQNKAPRAFLETLEGYQQRANWAQQNAFEAFPLFAAGVIIAQQAGAVQGTVDTVAVTWVGLRLAYGPAYLANIGLLRTLIWAAALACAASLFFIAA